MTPPRNSKTYEEKLKDPRWQKKRLEVLERDEWKCRCCDEDQEPLEIHHLVYRLGAEPWEYNNDELITFCHRCHKFEHNLLRIKKAGLDPAELERELYRRMGLDVTPKEESRA